MGVYLLHRLLPNKIFVCGDVMEINPINTRSLSQRKNLIQNT